MYGKIIQLSHSEHREPKIPRKFSKFRQICPGCEKTLFQNSESWSCDVPATTYVTRRRSSHGFVDHRTRHNVASMAAAPQGTELLIKGMAARSLKYAALLIAPSLLSQARTSVSGGVSCCAALHWIPSVPNRGRLQCRLHRQCC